MPTGFVPVICRQCGIGFGIRASELLPTGNYCSRVCSFKGKEKTPEQAFWDHVLKTETCWLWTGGVAGKGYGQFGKNNGQRFDSHRFSYELHIGPIPEGLFVCHTCDVPRCVNPEHLFLGTNQDNMQDAARKGRTTIGERNPRAKLTEEDVIELRSLWEPYQVTFQMLAEVYGVTDSSIRAAVLGVTWKHIPGIRKGIC